MNVTFHGKRDLPDVIKDLEIERFSWVIQVALNIFIRVFVRGRQRETRQGEGDVTIEGEIGAIWSEATGK